MNERMQSGEGSEMIYTVFFTEEDSARMPQDFESYKEAVEYAEEKGGQYVIVSTTGNVE